MAGLWAVSEGSNNSVSPNPTIVNELGGDTGHVQCTSDIELRVIVFINICL